VRARLQVQRTSVNRSPMRASRLLLRGIQHSTTDCICGHRIVRHVGLVQGSTVRTKHIGNDIFAGIKQFFGGELTAYTELLTEARSEAIARMEVEAEGLGANAVVGVKLVSSSVAPGASEILAYGTAVEIVVEVV
jgi:uncharacterized protein YbjQ (UPF0145 family)